MSGRVRVLFEGGYYIARVFTLDTSKGNRADTIRGQALFDVRVLFEELRYNNIVIRIYVICVQPHGHPFFILRFASPSLCC